MGEGVRTARLPAASWFRQMRYSCLQLRIRHHRYGLPERWEELKEDISEAGYPLCNANGNNLRKALGELIADAAACREALRELMTAHEERADDGERRWSDARATARALLEKGAV
jgi:hypothetical protein